MILCHRSGADIIESAVGVGCARYFGEVLTPGGFYHRHATEGVVLVLRIAAVRKLDPGKSVVRVITVGGGASGGRAESLRHSIKLPACSRVVVHRARIGGHHVGSRGKVNRLRAHHEAVHGVGGLVAVHDGFCALAPGDAYHAVRFRAHDGMRVAPCLLTGVGCIISLAPDGLLPAGGGILRGVGCEPIELQIVVVRGCAYETPLSGGAGKQVAGGIELRLHMQSSLGSRHPAALGGGDAVHLAGADVEGHAKAGRVFHHDVSGRAARGGVEIGILILQAVRGHGRSTCRTGFGRVCGRYGEMQRLAGGRGDEHLLAFEGNTPAPGGVVQGFTCFGVQGHEARTGVPLPAGSLRGRLILGIAIVRIAAAAGLAGAAHIAAVFLFPAVLPGLNRVAEELAVVGVAAIHRVIGHTAIDVVCAPGQNKRTHRAFPGGGTAVEILPFCAEQIHVDAQEAGEIGDIRLIGAEFGSLSKCLRNGSICQCRVGNQQITVVIHRHADGQLSRALEHERIAPEHKLILHRRLIHEVHTNAGIHRIPVAAGLLRFGESRAGEADGAFAQGEGKIGRLALGSGGADRVLQYRIHECMGCGSGLDAGIEVGREAQPTVCICRQMMRQDENLPGV